MKTDYPAHVAKPKPSELAREGSTRYPKQAIGVLHDAQTGGMCILGCMYAAATNRIPTGLRMADVCMELGQITGQSFFVPIAGSKQGLMSLLLSMNDQGQSFTSIIAWLEWIEEREEEEKGKD